MDKMISLEKDSAHIVSPDVMKKLKGKKISASMITGLEGCNARWLAETFVTREILPTPEDGANIRGSMFHSVMEYFFALPPHERTVEQMKKTVDDVLHMPDYNHFLTNHDAIHWLRDAVNGYYSMGGVPSKVKVAQVKNKKGDLVPGLEMFVSAPIGGSKRDTLGFVDLIQQDPKDDNAIIVQDWKSGKAKTWNPDKPDGEGYAEQRQQILYSMILEDMGNTVSGAQLVYPYAQHVERVRLHSDKLRETVVSDVEKTDNKLDTLEDTNEFTYSSSFLCNWCPLVKICPAAPRNAPRTGKPKTAYESQPEPDELTTGIEVL